MSADTYVWMSVWRNGTPHHQMLSAAGDEPNVVHRYTACGRYISQGAVTNGVVVRDEDAVAEKNSPRCPRCFRGAA